MNASIPVTSYMSMPVHTVTPTTELEQVDELLGDADVSGLAVVQDDAAPMGVISRSDLFRHGHGRKRAESLRGVVRDAMRSDVITVSPGHALAHAAELMTREHIHRVFVVRDDQLIGVVSTRDVMRAVADLRLDTPIGEVMSTPVLTIPAGEPLGLAASRLADAGKQGLVVVEDTWPLGIITQRDLLAARKWPPNVAIDEWMDLRVLSLPVGMAVHRAAAHALALDVRHVLAMNDEGLRGLLTGIDFARALANGDD